MDSKNEISVLLILLYSTSTNLTKLATKLINENEKLNININILNSKHSN